MSESAMMELHDETAEVLQRFAQHFTGLEARVVAQIIPGVAQVMVNVANSLRQEFQAELDALKTGQVSDDAIAATKERLAAAVTPLDAVATDAPADVASVLSTALNSVSPGLSASPAPAAADQSSAGAASTDPTAASTDPSATAQAA